MKIPILLEDKVECVHSGFVGIAVCRSEFINGCVQFDVVPKVGKKNEPKDAVDKSLNFRYYNPINPINRRTKWQPKSSP